jgi:hypothetical protein
MGKFTIDDVLRQADDNGCGLEVRRFIELGRNHNLAVQPKLESAIFAPDGDKRYSLWTIWPNVKSEEAGPEKKPNSMYIEVTIDVSSSGTRWDKHLGISEKVMLDTLQPFYRKRTPYIHGSSKYYVLYAHIDSSDINEAVERLNNLLDQARKL